MRFKRRLIGLALLALPYGQAMASPWPEANPDNVATALDQPLTISVLSNDVGTGLELVAVNAITTAGGSVVLNSDKQTVNYQPPSGFKGNDEFWYDFEDAEGRANAAKVTVNVGAETDIGERPEAWPVAVTDTASLSEMAAIMIPVLDNDIGVGLTLKSVNEWSLNGGRIRMTADRKTLSYETLIPTSEWPATDEFWYVFEDAWGRTNSAKVTVLLGYADKPEAWPDAIADSVTVNKNTPTKINVLVNDVGEGLSLKSVNTSSVNWGTISINGDKALYTPRYDFTGEDEFWYVFEDAWGRTNSAKVSIMVKAPNAVALNDTGVRTCGDYAYDTGEAHNNDIADCTTPTDSDGDPIPAIQDAMTGRDVTHNDDSDGIAGFSFTKLDNDGQPLPAEAEDWACVKDNTTGYIWESKKGNGLGQGAAGLHSADDTYFSIQSNGGPFASNVCYGHNADDVNTHCHTDKFVDRVNAEALCGITNWRMPILPELESLVNYGDSVSAIDGTFFPETKIGRYDLYLSSTGSAEDSLVRRRVSFHHGGMSNTPYFIGSFVRLVSDISRPAQP